MYDSIIILGATATGKTAVSINLAKVLNAEIVNADSMYIYKDLSIGTAKPTIDEMQGVKHHLISIVDSDKDFNVVDYKNTAEKVINDLKKQNRKFIVVGGTGLYIDSLINSYSYGETSHDYKLREKIQNDLKQFGNEYVYNKLVEIDNNSAKKIHPNDTTRLVRAMEVALSGKSISNQTNDCKPILKNPLIIGLNMDRGILYDRINQRVDLMIENGLIQEVKGLMQSGLTLKNQSMKGIGYKEIYSYLLGEMSLEEAIDKIKQHTRNYAKRQITWFKRKENVNWFDAKDQNLVEKILKLYNE